MLLNCGSLIWKASDLDRTMKRVGDFLRGVFEGETIPWIILGDEIIGPARVLTVCYLTSWGDTALFKFTLAMGAWDDTSVVDVNVACYRTLIDGSGSGTDLGSLEGLSPTANCFSSMRTDHSVCQLDFVCGEGWWNFASISAGAVRTDFPILGVALPRPFEEATNSVCRTCIHDGLYIDSTSGFTGTMIEVKKPNEIDPVVVAVDGEYWAYPRTYVPIFITAAPWSYGYTGPVGRDSTNTLCMAPWNAFTSRYPMITPVELPNIRVLGSGDMGYPPYGACLYDENMATWKVIAPSFAIPWNWGG